MTSTTRQVVLCVSPILYGRMEARAAAERFDLHAWVLHAVIGELLRPEAALVSERQARAFLAELPLALWPVSATERNPHAPHS